MVGILRIPGLQRLVGRSTALVSFTGRRSGRQFTTPVTYARANDHIVLTYHRGRNWFRNLSSNSQVQLRLAGREVEGPTQVVIDPVEAQKDLTIFLEALPKTAKASGTPLDANRRGDQITAANLLDSTVVVRVDVESTSTDVT